jgi:hypothetical protein
LIHGLIVKLERVKGIEPSSQAWEARILPLNHTRLDAVIFCHKVRASAILDLHGTPQSLAKTWGGVGAALFWGCFSRDGFSECSETDLRGLPKRFEWVGEGDLNHFWLLAQNQGFGPKTVARVVVALWLPSRPQLKPRHQRIPPTQPTARHTNPSDQLPCMANQPCRQYHHLP